MIVLAQSSGLALRLHASWHDTHKIRKCDLSFSPSQRCGVTFTVFGTCSLYGMAECKFLIKQSCRATVSNSSLLLHFHRNCNCPLFFWYLHIYSYTLATVNFLLISLDFHIHIMANVCENNRVTSAYEKACKVPWEQLGQQSLSRELKSGTINGMEC